MRDIIKSIVIKVLKLNDEQIEVMQENTNLIELGLDSLSSVEIVVFLENEFDIMIKDDDLLVENMATIKLLIELIEKYKES